MPTAIAEPEQCENGRRMPPRCRKEATHVVTFVKTGHVRLVCADHVVAYMDAAKQGAYDVAVEPIGGMV
jgi:hypothetical protein